MGYFYGAGDAVDNLQAVDERGVADGYAALDGLGFVPVTQLPAEAINVRRYGAIGNGTTDDTAAITNANTVGGDLLFPAGTYAIATNLTLSANVLMAKGALLKPASGVTVTISNSVSAGHFKVFDLSLGGTVTLGAAARVEFVSPRWWGAGDSGLDDAPAIQAAFNAAGQNPVHFPPGTYAVSSVTGRTGLIVQGSGVDVTNIRWMNATGDVINLTGFSNTAWRDMTFSPNGIQKTAGSVFLLSGGSNHLFENIRISSPYQGWTIGATNVTLRNVTFVEYNAAWPWNYGVKTDGVTATGIFLEDLVATSIGQAGMTNGWLWLNNSNGTTTLSGCIYNCVPTALNVTSCEWLYVTNCQFESSDYAAKIGGDSNGVHLHHNHFVSAAGGGGGESGILVSGNVGFPSILSIVGGEILVCGKHGIDIVTGKHIKIQGVSIYDVGQTTTDTYDGIRVAANLTDFEIIDNTVATTGHGNGNVPKYGVNVLAGTSARYKIDGNRIAAFGTADIFDGGTGVDGWVGTGVTGLTVPVLIGSLTLTDQASALNWLGTTSRYNSKVDLTGFRQVRLVVQLVVGSASANTPKLILRYHTADGQPFANFLDIGASEVSVSLTTAAHLASGWIDIAAAAKGDVFMAVLQSGGDGVADPSLGNAYAQFR